MVDIRSLEAIGANTKEGLARCLNNEAFYLKLVNKVIDDNKYPLLEEAIKNDDLDKAFEIVHSMKGVYGNLSLTPIYEKASEITELLRKRTKIDYKPLLDELKKRIGELEALRQ